MSTVKIIPTWHAALVIALRALEHGTPEGKKSAKELLQQMADVAQIAAKIDEHATQRLKIAPEDPNTYERGIIDAYTNILNLYNKEA